MKLSEEAFRERRRLQADLRKAILRLRHAQAALDRVREEFALFNELHKESDE